MKSYSPKVLFACALMLPIGIFAQGPNTNVQINPVQLQHVNHIVQVNNNDDNPQQANPPAQRQSGWNIFGTEDTKNKPCTDCEEVKTAIQAAKSSSSASVKSYHKKPAAKKWGKRFAYNFNLKMKKIVTRKYKAKTTYSACFNW